MSDGACPADTRFAVLAAFGGEAQPAALFEPVCQNDRVTAQLAILTCQGLGADNQTIAQRQRLLQTLTDVARHCFAMHALYRQVRDKVVELKDAKNRASILYTFDDLDLLPIELPLEDNAVGRHPRHLRRSIEPHRLMAVDQSRSQQRAT